MRKIFWYSLLQVLFFLGVATPGKLLGQSFTGTPTFSTASPYCANASLTANWTISGSFNAGNNFTVQLSDNTGSFASPVAIGTLSSSTNGTSVSATIPAASLAGAAYRFRVVASNPVATSANSAAFTINALGLAAPTFAGTTFCQTASFTLTNNLTNACAFAAGNIFTAQLSDISGSFASPVSIGSAAATTGGAITVTIPANTTAGTGYRIRAVSSNPVINGPNNGANIRINALGISAPVVTSSPYCQGQNISVTYTVLNACNFPNTPSNNIFTAQLSDATGLFASPTNIGSITSNASATISATIPAGTPAGSGYLIRVVSSNPGVIVGPDNGSSLTINASAGNPSVYGTTAWNAYVYNSTNFTNYAGFYTENNLSFNTTSRWPTASGPAVANASSGSAYAGCGITTTANWSIAFRRTNFTCGYYQLDLPSHDDNVTVLVNGSSVFSAICCTANLTNVWTGFLGPTSTVELDIVNLAGPGNLAATFTGLASPITTSPNVTVCTTASTTLTATAPVALNYAWTPTTFLTPASGIGAIVTVNNPASTQTYTVTGTDPVTTCTTSRNVIVTVSNASPTVNVVAAPSTTICSGITTATLTATGANTYSWSPATGLSATTGNVVTVSNLASNTTYTVTGNNGCASPGGDGTKAITINGQSVPGSPAPTVFGNNVWNAYVYNGTAFNPLYGYYTENSLSFNSTSKWNATNGPSVANASYLGCTLGGTQYSISFKRTNFTCNYYQIDLPYHDDNVTLLVDGVQVFQHNGCCDSHTNAWTGYLGASSQVEVRLINFAGPGSLQLSINPSASSPLSVNPSVTVCSGTSATLNATTSVIGATYAWKNSAGNTSLISSPTSATTFAGPLAANETYTITITDPVTTCTSAASVPVTVSAAFTTAVNPTSASSGCAGTSFTLTASGASTYLWSPAAGLNTTSGYKVIASPAVTTTYTVTGSNNCTSNAATSTITVNPLPPATTFPTTAWNVYGFNSTTVGTNYMGYYTENGTGATGYSFNTTTRWLSGAAPSTANATNGTAWLGCAMNATNISLSFKRTGFNCGIYQIDIPNHDDNFILIINGIAVAQHVGCCDAHTNLWTGSLSPSSTVEFRLVQGGGGSQLQATFTAIAQGVNTIVWTGNNSNDWFTTSNWCYSSVTIPTNTLDALIPAAGPLNMPAINAGGSVSRNVTVNPAIAAGTYTNAIGAASLSTLTTNNLNVFGNWTNNGIFNANAGTVTFTGGNAGNTISSSATQTFNNLTLNKTNPIILSSGTTQILGALTLTNGILTQSATLVVLNGGSTSGGTNSSYVDGSVQKTGNTAFTFPVGKAGRLRPVSISAPGLATDAFTATYFNTSPNASFPIVQHNPSLNRVSALEYWLLNRTNGTSNVVVTLSWDASSAVLNPSTLSVARWDVGSATWKDEGNGGQSGTAASGTIPSLAPVTTFSSPSPFTLGSTDSSNPLPIELVNFTAELKGMNALLKWETKSETNSDRFEIQRSGDGEKFALVGTLQGHGTTASTHLYKYEDAGVIQGSNYYRLRQVDFDGSFTYSGIVLVRLEGGYSSTFITPNPSSTKFTASSYREDITDIVLWDLQGKKVMSFNNLTNGRFDVDVSSLSPGLYIVEIYTSKGIFKHKMVKQ